MLKQTNKANTEIQIGSKALEKGALFNSNSLAFSKVIAQKGFAEQLAELRNQQQGNQFIQNQNPQDPKQNKAQDPTSLLNTQNSESTQEIIKQAEQQLAQQKQGLQHSELIKDRAKANKEQSQLADADEQAHKINASESVKAAAAQSNQKEITEAVKEGNAEQQQKFESANDRKRQLARWQDLAPTIIEDHRNKAIRLDIPGTVDIQTVIVRQVGKNNIDVSAIGSTKAMRSFKSKTGELSARFRKHDMNLNDLKVYDMRVVNS